MIFLNNFALHFGSILGPFGEHFGPKNRLKFVLNFKGGSEVDFGSSRAASNLKKYDFHYEKQCFLKIDLFAPGGLRGRFWTPKWSQNGDQNQQKKHKKHLSKNNAKNHQKGIPKGTILGAKMHPKINKKLYRFLHR